MATMSPSTFDPLLRYVNVRLQQGVPIVDADVNELDDVRKFELRAFLKWYVGDGVPEGNEGFRITGGLVAPNDNDFTITAGVPAPPAGSTGTETALRNVGRIVVDGLDVIITADLRHSQQPLHESQPGAAALAAKLGVPVVAKLTTPGVTTTLVAYLDLWERLVTPDEVPTLIHPGLGVETCARTRREWVVRVRPGTDVPKPGNSDFLAGHVYYALATLTRQGGQATVPTSAVLDRRERRLLVPPAHLLADTVGVDPLAYRRGDGRPVVSLRSAINALLAGQLPTSTDLAVSPGTGPDVLTRACTVDSTGGLVAIWQSPRVGSTNQVVAARLDLNQVDAGFAPAVSVSSGIAHLSPTAVALPNGDLVVAYQNGLFDATTTDVVMKRAPLAGLAAAPEQPVSVTANTADQAPFAVLVGDVVVFFFNQVSAGTSRWFYRRYRHTDDTFLDVNPIQLSPVSLAARDMHAAAVGGVVWVAFSDGTNLQLLRFNPTTAAIDNIGGIAAAGTLDVFVLATSATSAMVFYDDGSVLRSVTWTGSGSSVVVSGTDAADGQPAAVRDVDGNLYLVSTRPVPDASNDIILRRRNAVTGEWTPPQRLSPNAANDQRPFPVFAPGQGIWVLWMSDRTGNFDLFAKRVITAI